MSKEIIQNTASQLVTKTHVMAVAATGGGLGLSISDVTEIAQLVAAVSGAIVGCWAVIDLLRKSKKRKQTAQASQL